MQMIYQEHLEEGQTQTRQDEERQRGPGGLPILNDNEGSGQSSAARAPPVCGSHILPLLGGGPGSCCSSCFQPAGAGKVQGESNSSREDQRALATSSPILHRAALSALRRASKKGCGGASCVSGRRHRSSTSAQRQVRIHTGARKEDSKSSGLNLTDSCTFC